MSLILILKKKIIHGFDVHEQLINNGVEFHVLEEKKIFDILE